MAVPAIGCGAIDVWRSGHREFDRPGNPAPERWDMAVELTEEMAQHVNNAFTNRIPCVLATASAEGAPDIGFKGSMMVFDGEHLAYWERTRGQHLANVERNPKVAVLYHNIPER